MTNLLRKNYKFVTVHYKYLKIPHQPQCTLQLVCEDSNGSISVSIQN